MLQLRGDLDFPNKTIGAEGSGQFGTQHLDRNIAVVLEVFGEIDCRHAAGTEFTLDEVAIVERSLQAVEVVGHRVLAPLYTLLE